MKLPAVVVAVMLISLPAALYAAEEEMDLRAAPWWRALRAETYYKQCHSSCTESSQGTKTTVELCDDTEVLVGLVAAQKIMCNSESHPVGQVTEA